MRTFLRELQRPDQNALPDGSARALANDLHEVLFQNRGELENPGIVGALLRHFGEDQLANYQMVLMQHAPEGQELRPQ